MTARGPVQTFDVDLRQADEPRPAVRSCSAPGCERLAVIDGLCMPHHEQAQADAAARLEASQAAARSAEAKAARQKNLAGWRLRGSPRGGGQRPAPGPAQAALRPPARADVADVDAADLDVADPDAAELDGELPAGAEGEAGEEDDAGRRRGIADRESKAGAGPPAEACTHAEAALRPARPYGPARAGPTDEQRLAESRRALDGDPTPLEELVKAPARPAAAKARTKRPVDLAGLALAEIWAELCRREKEARRLAAWMDDVRTQAIGKSNRAPLALGQVPSSERMRGS